MLEPRRLFVAQLGRYASSFDALLKQLVPDEEVDPDLFFRIAYDRQNHLIAVIDTDSDTVVAVGAVRISMLVGNIPCVVVHEWYRRSGIGRLLMQRLHKVAGEHDCVQCTLQASPAVRDFYLGLGYIPQSKPGAYVLHFPE